MKNLEIKSIGVDMDEVLYPFSDVIFDYYHRRDGSVRNFDGRGVGYRFHHAWGMTEEKVMERVETFFATDEHDLAEPLDGSIEGIQKLAAKGISLTVITARQRMSEAYTYAWLDKHFSGLFDDVILCNHFPSNGDRSIPKAEALKDVGGDMLIDDSPKHVKSVLDKGFEGVLFGNYSWNYGDHGLNRAHNWSELTEGILGINE